MTDLTSVTMRELLPPNLRDDPDAIAASAALEPIFAAFTANLRREIIFSNINELDGPTLDRLARDLHIEWYDEGLTLKNKRDTVRNSLAIHALKGTPWAVEQAVTDLYEGGTIREWFEYGGDPYRFRIRVEGSIGGLEGHRRLIRNVNAVKNVRSWLDGIEEHIDALGSICIGTMAIAYDRVVAQLPPAPEARAPMYFGAAATTYQRDIARRNDA